MHKEGCTTCQPMHSVPPYSEARGSVQILDSAADARAIIMEPYGAKCCISFAPSTSTSRAKLHQWGILVQSKTETTWTCTTCPTNKRGCDHAKKGESVMSVDDYSEYEHLRRFEAWFDCAKDQRRLTCQSTRPIPTEEEMRWHRACQGIAF